MSVECPVCRAPVSRIRIIRTTAWGRWRCASCGSLLGVDIVRRFTAFIPLAVVLGVLVIGLRITRWNPMITLPLLVVITLGWFMVVDRPAVHERCGFRCRECGYDLKGQTAPACPECGEAFTDEDRALLEAVRTGRQLPVARVPIRGRIIALVVVLLLAGLSIAGVFMAKAYSAPAPAPPPATSTP